jgi:hypothetical protein
MSLIYDIHESCLLYMTYMSHVSSSFSCIRRAPFLRVRIPERLRALYFTITLLRLPHDYFTEFTAVCPDLQRDCDTVFTLVDANASGGIDFTEFQKGLRECWGVSFSSKITLDLFNKYDHDHR